MRTTEEMAIIQMHKGWPLNECLYFVLTIWWYGWLYWKAELSRSKS